jgi:hypothetical protein
MGVLPQLPLDHRQRDPFVGHLDRVRMSEPVRREAMPDPRRNGESAQLAAGGGR